MESDAQVQIAALALSWLVFSRKRTLSQGFQSARDLLGSVLNGTTMEGEGNK